MTLLGTSDTCGNAEREQFRQDRGAFVVNDYLGRNEVYRAALTR